MIQFQHIQVIYGSNERNLSAGTVFPESDITKFNSKGLSQLLTRAYERSCTAQDLLLELIMKGFNNFRGEEGSMNDSIQPLILVNRTCCGILKQDVSLLNNV